AIVVLQSISRLTGSIQSEQARAAAGRLREVLATYQAREDLIAIGAYQMGSDPRTDYAVDHVHALDAFLRQPPHLPEQAEIAESRLAAMLADSADAFGDGG
ncbi:MAG: synthase in type secretion protein, partial [Gaiellales bacterium]|nr:synthase in type secretion protein [Gaiellales bacterium]